jgi:plastocyanin
MLSGRYLFVFVVMIWGMNAVPANAATIQVTIDKLVFSPVEVKAKVGDTITWIIRTSSHIRRLCAAGFDVMIEANKSASWVLKKAGIVEYYCRFHPNMKGRITITPE